MPIALFLGGARSGKTRLALAHAESLSSARVYVATAEALDAEMAARIARHQAERGPGWRTVEAPLDIAPALAAIPPGEAILIDCLTLWISNIMHHGRDLEAELDRLSAALLGAAAPVVLVSNEVGSGLVPETPLGRAFRDAQGLANQRIAALADTVTLAVAGLPLRLKGG